MKARLILTVSLIALYVLTTGQDARPNLYEVQEAFRQQSRSVNGQTEEIPGYKLFKRAEHYYETEF